MRLKCSNLSVVFSYDGGSTLTLQLAPESVKAAREALDELKGCTISVDLAKWRERRSLDANAYCFVLIDKICAKTGEGKTAYYKRAVREIGGNSDTICCKDIAVDALCSGWEGRGLGWQTEKVPSKLEGCTNVVLYYGSSTYDTETMSRLIDFCKQDAESLGIQTMTPREEAELLERWEASGQKRLQR